MIQILVQQCIALELLRPEIPINIDKVSPPNTEATDTNENTNLFWCLVLRYKMRNCLSSMLLLI